MNTNLRSAVYITHLAAKHIVESKGNIINISSIAGQSVISKESFSYGTSKAGLDHFTRSIALELGSKGVRVNAISPGPVKTDFLENMGLEKSVANHAWDAIKKATLLDRVGDAEEIGDLAAFLASDKARSITGTTIITDNGAILLGPIDNHLEL